MNHESIIRPSVRPQGSGLRAVMIPVISDSGIGIPVGFKEPELEAGAVTMIGAGTIAGIGTTSGIGSIAGNSFFVGSAPLRKDEQAWDQQERALFLVV